MEREAGRSAAKHVHSTGLTPGLSAVERLLCKCADMTERAAEETKRREELSLVHLCLMEHLGVVFPSNIQKQRPQT